LRKPYPAAQ